MKVVAAVLPGQEPGSVRVYRRGAAMQHGGMWEFPGGKVEPGESEGEALARELREELDLRVVVGARLWAGRLDTEPAFEISFYACSAVAGEESLREHDAARDVGFAGWQELDWAPGDAPFVAWFFGDRAID